MTDQIGTANMTQGASTKFTSDRFNCPNSALALNGGWARVPAGIYFSDPQFTVSVWILPHQLGTWCRLFDFGNGWRTDNICVTLAAGNPLQPSLFLYSPTEYAFISSQYLTYDQWQFFAITFDGVNSIFYINGTQVAKKTDQAYSLPRITRTNCYIGKPFDAAGYSYSFLDDLRFYKKALTQQEIVNE